jgi:hypothetical protein
VVAAASVFRAVVSASWGEGCASAWCRALASRVTTAASRSGRTITKLHEPTEGIASSCPGKLPAGWMIGFRKVCLARTRRISSAVGAMKRPPSLLDITVRKPGQPAPPPHRAPTRPSSTIAGPSPARSR